MGETAEDACAPILLRPAPRPQSGCARARTCACWKGTLLQQQGKGPATVAMVKLAPRCELAPPAPHFPRCSTALSKIHLHISPLLLRLPVHPSVSPHAGHRFSSSQFFFFCCCHPFVFPASSFPSLPHLSFMPQWPPHGLQTEPECDLHASSRADRPEAGGSTRPSITTQNPDIHMQLLGQYDPVFYDKTTRVARVIGATTAALDCSGATTSSSNQNKVTILTYRAYLVSVTVHFYSL